MGQRFRTVLATANKYQEQIILMTLIPMIILCAFFSLIIYIANGMFMAALFEKSVFELQDFVNRFSWAIVGGLFFLLLVLLGVSFVLSSKIVGGFDRIIKELDDVIEHRSSKEITCRPQDELASHLLKRINVLIKAYSQK